LHSIALDNYGWAYSWGYNSRWQLGLGDSRDRLYPILISSDFSNEIFESVERITAGGSESDSSGHNISRKTDGTFWVWGSNVYGELGVGDNYNTQAPLLMSSITDWFQVTAGGLHTIGLKNNGTLWTWGRNNYGQLGLGDSGIDRNTPTQVIIGSDIDWSRVSGGDLHTIALKTNGTIWTWGRNRYGQLGLGNTQTRWTPAQVIIGSDIDWSLVAGGSYHTIALKTGGTIWTWGWNNYGQLGLGDTQNRLTPAQIIIGSDIDWSLVSGGAFHSIALKTGGMLWTWGNNAFGQLGIGDTSHRRTPVQIGIQTDWSIIETGDDYSLGLKLNGIVWAWGKNEYGQLGLQDTMNRNTPTLVIIGLPEAPANLSAIVISSSEIILSWADNANNEAGFRIERKTGRDGTYDEIVPQGGIGPNVTTWSDISAGGFAPATCYYYRIRAFNNFGNSIYSNEVYNAVSGNWTEVSAGYYYTVGRKSTNTIWTWGKNDYGQLGLGDSGNSTSRNTPTLIGSDSDWAKVIAGYYHAIGHKTTGTLWTWGYNNLGQLGLGDSGTGTNRNTPTQIGTTSDWSMLAAGRYHTIGLKTTGTFWAWGYNYYGQLGLGDSTDRNTPTQVGSDSDWVEVTCSYGHTIGRKTTRTIWAWGYNEYGQLGLGDSGPDTHRNTPFQIGSDSDWVNVSAGGYYTIANKINGTLWSWGYNGFGQLGLGDSGNGTDRNSPTQIESDSDWAEVVAGWSYTFGCKTTGTLWVWGATPTQIGIDSDWVKVVAGYRHTLGRKTTGTLWSWGYNEYGQLGLGDSGTGTDRNVPILVEE
jgi:alpha-tubulin suppressor-like RCC1 family protein